LLVRRCALPVEELECNAARAVSTIFLAFALEVLKASPISE
jgi:hypothetical protein